VKCGGCIAKLARFAYHALFTDALSHDGF